MTLDHFGKPISYYLYQCFGYFSAAEGFFFLSGFVGMLAATSKQAKDPSQSWMRSRAARIWKYHCATLISLCIIAAWFLPSLAANFKCIFQHPLESLFWSALLINTPEWLDVLPLYVVFLILGSVLFPLFVKARCKTQVFLLWLPSLVVWIGALLGLRDAVNSLFPSWIHHGDFDPFAWQFIYFTGAAVAAWWKRAKSEENAHSSSATEPAVKSSNTVRVIQKLTPAVLVLLAFCFLWSHQFIPLQLPTDFWTNKVHVGPLRFANFFCFVMAIGWIIRTWPAALDFRVTNLIGRHSLDVYTAHIVLIYFWFATPGSIRYHAPWNVLVPIAACVFLWTLSRIREPRK
ncbi:MAG: OpgC domain-containing protein [Fibrobacter sp.]|nr:OpgC domain-containing protein [Fibrobacter sp.]